MVKTYENIDLFKVREEASKIYFYAICKNVSLG